MEGEKVICFFLVTVSMPVEHAPVFVLLWSILMFLPHEGHVELMGVKFGVEEWS